MNAFGSLPVFIFAVVFSLIQLIFYPRIFEFVYTSVIGWSNKRKISQDERKDEVVGDFVVLDFLPRGHDFWYATRVVDR